MTNQVQDPLYYQGQVYFPQSAALFIPSDYGFTPQPISSACTRGYECKFNIEGSRLLLASLQVGMTMNLGASDFDEPPLIALNGQLPKVKISVHHYDNLNMPLSYSGKCLLSRFRIDEQQEVFDKKQKNDSEKFWMMTFEQGELLSFEPYDSHVQSEPETRLLNDDEYLQQQWQNLGCRGTFLAPDKDA